MSQMYEFLRGQKWLCKRCSQAFVPFLRFSIHTNHTAWKALKDKDIGGRALHEWFIPEPYWTGVRGLGTICSQLDSKLRRRTC